MGTEDTRTEDPTEGPDDDAEVPVVGIGASAGGLEAMRELLEALPADTGMAYVFVQHLAPDQESHAAEALEKHTGMPVSQVTEDVELEPDHLYVNAPDAVLTVEGSQLKAGPRPTRAEASDLVDRLLLSLAEERGPRSVGVVLSGTLSDGTRGLREIRAAGGFTLAQDPSTTRYRSMPQSAIQAGSVDVSGTPKALADELVRLGREALHHPEGRPGAETLTPDQATLDRLFEVVREGVGVNFADYKKSTLRRRLHRRMMATGIDDLEAYVDRLEDDPDEVMELYNEFLIQVTGFFRDPEAVQDLEERALPTLLEDRDADEPIRVWVPACATGEEAYSLAILLAEAMDELGETFPVQIFATDVSAGAIRTARNATYPEAIEADISDERLERFFTRTDGSYTVVRRLRGMCVFAVQDVTSDPPFSNMDLISCRNLLIYMEPELQRRVVSSLHYALKPDGRLLVGRSESLGRFENLFEHIDPDRALYRKRDVTPPPIHSFSKEPQLAAPDEGADRGPVQTWGGDQLRREADRILSERYAPPSIVVNHDLEVLEFRGETGPYLRHTGGEPSLNLMRLARKGLAVELNKALEETRDKGERVVHQDVTVEQPEGGTRKVDLEVVPFHGPGVEEPNFVVIFHESRTAGKRSERSDEQRGPGLLSRIGRALGGGPTATDEAQDEEVERLEEELEATQAYLQTVIEEYEATTEELRSANEEALSTNEELQSTNEELQTAKEELQSTNEELQTLNDELQERNQEIEQVNNDLVNLLESVDMPILMLDEELRIRRFTPKAEEALNLIPTDVDRPLTDIRLPLDVEDLSGKIEEVLENPLPQEHEVVDEEGRDLVLRITPYRTGDDEVAGAVVVLVSQEG